VLVNSELRQYQDSALASSSEVHSTDISKETSNPEGCCGLAQPLHHNTLFFCDLSHGVGISSSKAWLAGRFAKDGQETTWNKAVMTLLTK
jgi:hypothetical protein